jgi:ubiquinone/menaquinone biosynthesis C-methylase UbiE
LRVIYQHPLAYLIGLEGLALLRAWAGNHDEEFIRARLDEVRVLLEDEALTGHPGVHVTADATDEAYRQWAPSYDDPGNELLALDLPLVREILASAPGGTAVDAGCGTGRLAALLAEQGHAVTGVDSSEPMLELARDRVPGARFLVGDLTALPLPDDSSDVATTGLALTHVPDLEPVLMEFARVLRPGGQAIISDVHPDLLFRGSVVKSESDAGRPQVAAFHLHSVADHVRAALTAGFTLRRLEELRVDTDATVQPGERSTTDLGPWRLWPWTLLELVPEAARSAWDNPSLLVLHLELA